MRYVIIIRPFYFSVEPKAVLFQFGNYEPFFCSIALYDVSTKKKISENFSFQHLADNVLQLLGSNWVCNIGLDD